MRLSPPPISAYARPSLAVTGLDAAQPGLDVVFFFAWQSSVVMGRPYLFAVRGSLDLNGCVPPCRVRFISKTWALAWGPPLTSGGNEMCAMNQSVLLHPNLGV